MIGSMIYVPTPWQDDCRFGLPDQGRSPGQPDPQQFSEAVMGRLLAGTGKAGALSLEAAEAQLSDCGIHPQQVTSYADVPANWRTLPHPARTYWSSSFPTRARAISRCPGWRDGWMPPSGLPGRATTMAGR